jgi:hypothetical protein
MTPEERKLAERLAAEAVAELKAAGVLQPLPSLLEMSYRDIQRLVQHGAVLAWLADQLANRWAPWPDLPLSDMLKTERRDRIESFARMLAQAGIHDLDELLLPDPGPEVLGDDDG